jgi:hypothetical protein
MASGVIQVMSTDRNDQVKRHLKAELDSIAARLHTASDAELGRGRRKHARAGDSPFDGVARYEQP